jgi:uncharacterized protein (TIGR03435 family)
MAALTTLAVAQTVRQETDSIPRFEVVSIKPSAPGSAIAYGRWVPGEVMYQDNMTVEALMVNAWHVQPYQIIGAPAWIRTARYDISAKPEKAPKPSEVPLMWQILLADRFGLAVHRETRDLPIYALVIARKDGKPGPARQNRPTASQLCPIQGKRLRDGAAF